MKIKVGINKQIFEKRLELKLSRKVAAKKIGISKLKLTLFERGYIKINKKNQLKFINAYSLEPDFFDNHYEYPIIINEKLYEPLKQSTFLDKVGSSKKVKIISLITAIAFTAMCVIGICTSPKINGTTPNLYTNNVKEVQRYVVENGKEGISIPEDSDFACLISDRYYYIEKEYEGTGDAETISFTFYAKESNLPNAYCNGTYKQSIFSDDYSVKFQSRYIKGGSTRVHAVIKDYYLIINYPISNITCDVNYDEKIGTFNYNFVSVIKGNQGSGNQILKPGDEYYDVFTNVFKDKYPKYCSDLKSVYEELILVTPSFETFQKELRVGTTEYYSYLVTSSTLAIIGFILAILACGVFIVSLLLKNNADKRYMKFVNDSNEQKGFLEETIEAEPNKKTLKRNKWLDLLVPEFGVRTVSLLLLFAGSIATFIIFLNAVTINVSGIITSLGYKALLTNLSVIAVMLLYFLKLDIYQNKKSAFIVNMFEFILGLLYYLVLLLVYYGLCGLNDTIGTITTALFSLLPGNIVWAVLVFNQIILFMFAPVKDKYKNKKHAELKLRLMTLLPFSYLVASCVITAGMSNGWKIPYAISSLFMSKAPMITVFAVAYCVAVFIYRRVVKKKYGETNAVIYMNGNKYNFIRNTMAASIVALIGVFDLLCFFYWPNNAMGFGNNWLMLFTVPIILFYHTHLGKRNGTWDIIFNILYGLAYVVGIVLIVLSLLNILTKI